MTDATYGLGFALYDHDHLACDCRGIGEILDVAGDCGRGDVHLTMDGFLGALEDALVTEVTGSAGPGDNMWRLWNWLPGSDGEDTPDGPSIGTNAEDEAVEEFGDVVHRLTFLARQLVMTALGTPGPGSAWYSLDDDDSLGRPDEHLGVMIWIRRLA